VLVELPPNNGDHDDVRMRTTVVVGQFFLLRDEGRFFSGDTGYYLRRNPDRVRAPDLSYFVPERAPVWGQRGFYDIMPDLVIEIVSPGDTAAEVESKVLEWLGAGVRLAAVLYPDSRSVMVYRGANDVRHFTAADTLDFEPVLPGFSCTVAQLFPPERPVS
jgi:Uma2 family endonuclease